MTRIIRHTDDVHEVRRGDMIRVPAGEVHHFRNDTEADFSFFELWVPAPERTVWVDADDI
ncbi:MAG: cupin domain-containing protein [Chloroflexota bacterium]|nr:cupin domain-containing protein [Chloroflexota bacterium]